MIASFPLKEEEPELKNFLSLVRNGKKKRYGKKKIVMDLAQASNNTSSLRATYDAVEKYLRSLQSLGEDIHHRQIISIIRTKLPKVVISSTPARAVKV